MTVRELPGDVFQRGKETAVCVGGPFDTFEFVVGIHTEKALLPGRSPGFDFIYLRNGEHRGGHAEFVYVGEQTA